MKRKVFVLAVFLIFGLFSMAQAQTVVRLAADDPVGDWDSYAENRSATFLLSPGANE